MQASVIIPHYNDIVRLEKCMASLVPQVAEKDVEILVVDNASSQDLEPLRKQFPEVQFLLEPEPGAAAARNLAVKHAQGDWLFFTDADCVPAANWIDVAISLSKGDQVIGGHVSLFDESTAPRSGTEAFEHVFAFNQETYIKKTHYSVTANMLASRAVFDQVGPFDGSMSEDLEWGQRAYGMGYQIVYRPELEVAHPTRQNWAALANKWRRTTREMYFANGTSFLPRFRWGVRSFAILCSIPAHAVKILAHGDLTAGDKLKGIGILIRIRCARTLWTLKQSLFGETSQNRLKRL
jgi:GT2 family glycosyltransferase